MGSAGGRLGEVLGAAWTPFGGAWRRLGEVLGTAWTPFGAFREGLGGSLDASGAFVGFHGARPETR